MTTQNNPDNQHENAAAPLARARLAHIVASANIQRLSLVGLSKNAGKTTATNQLLETLLGENLYRADKLAITSLGLDGEATDVVNTRRSGCCPLRGLTARVVEHIDIL
jgi:hypothetical protein